MAKLIAQAYGQALYELAVEENRVNDLLEEVKALKTAFSDGDEFLDFIKHPQITKEEKENVLTASLKGNVSDDMVGFLKLIVEKDRTSEIIPIFDYFIKAVDELMGVGNAEVCTPLELTDAQKEKIEKKLLDTTKYKEINVDYDVDASLIGGMVIRIGDRVVDSSIKTRLYELKKELSKVQM